MFSRFVRDIFLTVWFFKCAEHFLRVLFRSLSWILRTLSSLRLSFKLSCLFFWFSSEILRSSLRATLSFSSCWILKLVSISSLTSNASKPDSKFSASKLVVRLFFLGETCCTGWISPMSVFSLASSKKSSLHRFEPICCCCSPE